MHNTLELKRGPLDTESSALSTKTHASLTGQPKTFMYVLFVMTMNVTIIIFSSVVIIWLIFVSPLFRNFLSTLTLDYLGNYNAIIVIKSHNHTH